MIKSKYTLRVLGAALMAALGLMAFGVAGAQALTQGVFLVAGKPVPAGTLYLLKAALEGLTGELLSELAGGVKVGVLCEEVTITEQEAVSEKDLRGTVSFTKCKVNEPTNCTVDEPITSKVLVLALLHTPTGGTEETYIVFEPQSGEKFTELQFLGASCTLPVLPVEIKGKVVAKDCQLEILVEKEIHLLTEVPHGLGLTGETGLKFGNRPAELMGSVNAFVEHKTTGIAQKWSAH